MKNEVTKEYIEHIEEALFKKYRTEVERLGDTRYRRPTITYTLEMKKTGNIYTVSRVWTDWHKSHIEVVNTKTNERKFFNGTEKLAKAIAYGYIK